MARGSSRHIETILPLGAATGGAAFNSGVIADSGSIQAGQITLVTGQEVTPGVTDLTNLTATYSVPQSGSVLAAAFNPGGDSPAWVASGAGSFNVTATVDPLGAIVETDDTNNSKSAVITVGSGSGGGGGGPPPPQLPDLVIQSASLSPLDASGNVVIGTEITFGALLANAGLGPTPTGSGQPGNHRLGFYIDDPTAGAAALVNWEDSFNGPMAPSGTQQLFSTGGPSSKSTWTAAGSVGPHTLTVWADPPGLIAESNEGNNLLTISFTLVNAPAGGGGGGGPGTRDVRHWPFAWNSIWNMPRGEGAVGVPAGLGGGYVNCLASGGFGGSVYNAPPDANIPQSTANSFHEGHTAVIGGGALAFGTPTLYGATTGAIEYYRYQDPGDSNFLWYDIDLRGQGIKTYQSAHSGGNGFRRTHVLGTPTMGGLIRKFDITQGVIRHALECELGAGALAKNGGAAVWPGGPGDVDGDWATSYSGSIPMGSYLFIPSGTAMPTGLSAVGQMVFHAFQDYGCYVVDRSNGFTLRAEANVGDAAMAPLDNTGGAELGRLTPLLVRCTNNATALGQANINGPAGTSQPAGAAPGRRAPLAPDVGASVGP